MTWRPITRGQDVFWEDLSVGDVITAPGITITDSHLVTWAGLTGDWVSLHLDEEYAARTPFGKRIGHGPLTFALGLGLMTQTGIFGNVVAWLGADEVRALAPVFVGDTLRPQATIVETRQVSKGGRGIWTLEYKVNNQDDVTVLSFRSSLMILRRPATGDDG